MVGRQAVLVVCLAFLLAAPEMEQVSALSVGLPKDAAGKEGQQQPSPPKDAAGKEGQQEGQQQPSPGPPSRAVKPKAKPMKIFIKISSVLTAVLIPVASLFYVIIYINNGSPVEDSFPAIGRALRKSLTSDDPNNANWDSITSGSADQILVTVMLVAILLLSYVSTMIGMVAGHADKQASTLMTARVAEELRRYKYKDQRLSSIERVERVAARSEPVGLEAAGPLLEAVCDMDGLSVCPLADPANWGAGGQLSLQDNKLVREALRKMREQDMPLREMPEFKNTDWTTAVDRGASMENEQLFRHMTGQDKRVVDSEVMFAELTRLGFGLPAIQAAVKRASKHGKVSVPRFRKFLLKPVAAGFLWRLSRFRFVFSSVALFMLSGIILFSTHMELQEHVPLLDSTFFSVNYVVALCLFVLISGFCATVAAAPTLSDENAALKEHTDSQLSNAYGKIVTAFMIQVLFSLIYFFLMKTCTAPTPSCPQLSYRDPTIFCQQDVYSQSDRGETCQQAVQCSTSGSMYWRQPVVEDSVTTPQQYLLNKVNAQMYQEKDQTMDDYFADFKMLRKEARRISAPGVVGICAEQTPPEGVANVTSRVSRSRRGKLEQLLDFGVNASIKEVLFVPVGSECPVSATSAGTGRVVHPRAIGVAPDDLAYYTFNTSARTRRFEYMIPDAVIGENYYHMCERLPVQYQKMLAALNASSPRYTELLSYTGNLTAQWSLIDDAYYLFGVEATCGSVECGESDFTDKMEDDAIMKLYFTSVTHSSIGYGDISPASRRMRQVIAMHALIMIMIGLM